MVSFRIEQNGHTVRRQQNVDVFICQGVVSRNHVTPRICVCLFGVLRVGLECYGDGLSLSFFPYFRTGK